MNDVNYFMGIIHCTFHTADNYGVKMFVFYYRNRLLDLLINYVMKLIIRLFVNKNRISLFNHFFYCDSHRTCIIEISYHEHFFHRNQPLLELQIVASGVYMLHIDL